MKYSPKQREELFSLVMQDLESGKPLRQILDTPNRPSASAFYEWMRASEDFTQRYARATEIRADKLFDEMHEIANAPIIESELGLGPDGLEIMAKDVIAHRKLQIDTYKWTLAKMQPKKYGDKIDVTSDNKALAPAPIVGMVIQNKTQESDGFTDDLL